MSEQEINDMPDQPENQSTTISSTNNVPTPAENINQTALSFEAKLEKELQMSKVHRLKIDEKWRTILRTEKCHQLKTALTQIKQSFSKDMEQTDDIINIIHQQFEQAQDQFQRALGVQLKSVDAFIDLLDDQLLCMEQEFDTNLGSIRRDFKRETEISVKQHEADIRDLHEKIASIEMEEVQFVAKEKRDQQHLIEEIRNGNLEEVNGLRVVLESKIEDLEEQFDAAHVDYLQKTDQRTTDYKQLSQEDRKIRREMEQKMKKIDRLQNTLQRYRNKHTKSLKENKEQHRLLLQRKSNALQKYQVLKEKMQGFRDRQHKTLVQITKSARKSKETLEERYKLADRIIRFSELCKKVEMGHDRIIPYLSSALETNLEAQATRMVNEKRQQTSTINESGQSGITKGDEKEGWNRGNKWDVFDPFWKKYNKVLLDVLFVEKEENRAKKQREELKGMLKLYLDGISINDHVIKNDNCLLVINGRVGHEQVTRVTTEAKSEA